MPGSMDSGIGLWVNSQLCHLLTVGRWVGYFTLLSLNIFTSEICIIRIAPYNNYTYQVVGRIHCCQT